MIMWPDKTCSVYITSGPDAGTCTVYDNLLNFPAFIVMGGGFLVLIIGLAAYAAWTPEKRLH